MQQQLEQKRPIAVPVALLNVTQKRLVFALTKALDKQLQELLPQNLHLRLDVNWLVASQQICRLSLLTQIDHIYSLAKQPRQMLQGTRFANTRLTAQQHRLVAFDASRHLLQQPQRRLRVDKEVFVGWLEARTVWGFVVVVGCQ